MKRMMICLLPSICKCYSKLAVVSAILNSSYEGRLWFYINYFNLIFSGVPGDGWVWMDLCGTFDDDGRQEWECCPFIESEAVCMDDFTEKELKAFVINSLDQDKMVYCNIDYFYLFKNYDQHFLHDVLIVGYNLFDNTFLCKDYFDIEYKELWIPMENVAAAFSSKKTMEDRIQKTYLLKERMSTCATPLAHLNKTLHYYIEGRQFVFREPLCMPGVFTAYGAHVYDCMAARLDLLFSIPDIKPFYAIRDHFIIVGCLARVLDSCIKEAEELEKQAQMLCLFSLKYKVCPSYGIMEKIKKSLRELKNKEGRVLEKWLQIL